MIYSNLKRYNQKGQRLSIFAKVNENNTLSLYVQKCSKKDQFRKSYARELAEYYFTYGKELFTQKYSEEHPEFFNILIEDGKPKITFLNWCRDNYYKVKEECFTCDEAMLSSQEYVKTLLAKITKDKNIFVKILVK